MVCLRDAFRSKRPVILQRREAEHGSSCPLLLLLSAVRRLELSLKAAL